MRLLTPRGNFSKASHSNIRKILSFVKLPKLSVIVFNARHLARSSFSSTTKFAYFKRELLQSLTSKHDEYFQLRQVAKALWDPYECPTSCKIQVFMFYEVAYTEWDLLQSLTITHVQYFQFCQVDKVLRDPLQCPTCCKI